MRLTKDPPQMLMLQNGRSKSGRFRFASTDTHATINNQMRMLRQGGGGGAAPLGVLNSSNNNVDARPSNDSNSIPLSHLQDFSHPPPHPATTRGHAISGNVNPNNLSVGSPSPYLNNNNNGNDNGPHRQVQFSQMQHTQQPQQQQQQHQAMSLPPPPRPLDYSGQNHHHYQQQQGGDGNVEKSENNENISVCSSGLESSWDSGDEGDFTGSGRDPSSCFDAPSTSMMSPSLSERNGGSSAGGGVSHSSSSGNGHHGHHHHHGNGSSSSLNNSDREEQALFGLSSSEERFVRYSKFIFIACLVISALVLAATVFLLTYLEEKDDFETRFDNLGFEVIDFSTENVQQVFDVLKGLSATMTSKIVEQQQLQQEQQQEQQLLSTFSEDNMTISSSSSSYPPGFLAFDTLQQLFLTARGATKASIMIYLPLIASADEYKLWQNFSEVHQDWITKYNYYYNQDGKTTTTDSDTNATTATKFQHDPILNYIWEPGNSTDDNDDEFSSEETTKDETSNVIENVFSSTTSPTTGPTAATTSTILVEQDVNDHDSNKYNSNGPQQRHRELKLKSTTTTTATKEKENQHGQRQRHMQRRQLQQQQEHYPYHQRSHRSLSLCDSPNINFDDTKNKNDDKWGSQKLPRERIIIPSSDNANDEDDDNDFEPLAPVWIFEPPPPLDDTYIVNNNLLQKNSFSRAVRYIHETGGLPTLVDACNHANWFNPKVSSALETNVVYPVYDKFPSTLKAASASFAPYVKKKDDKGSKDDGDSKKDIDEDESPPKIVGYLLAVLPWHVFFENILSQGAEPIHVVMTSTCGDAFTFLVNETSVTLLSDHEDVHDEDYNKLSHTSNFAEFFHGKDEHYTGQTLQALNLTRKDLDYHCFFDIATYPTSEMEEKYRTFDPILYSMLVILIFAITSIFFVVFDRLVQKRQAKVMSTALKQNAIVSSLFPKSIQAKIMAEVDEQQQLIAANNNHSTTTSTRLSGAGKAGLRNFLIDVETKEVASSTAKSVLAMNNNNKRRHRRRRRFGSRAKVEKYLGDVGGGSNKRRSHNNNDKMNGVGMGMAGGNVDKSKPIADLFPETTIMFADISGFTAWSSAREPSQVFTLLETIYHEFDAIAKKRRVFKVEVVGDCYVAVCGLPDPREDHAVVMARFAHECLRRMLDLTRQLEIQLGPETTDLGLRVGLHSGPVVAGVLRGEKSRFQLFGDTMNTASRMESTGFTNRIQMSQETADLIMQSGKPHWCIPRPDKVVAKGKGMLSTYFLKTSTGRRGSGMSVSSGASTVDMEDFEIRDQEELIAKKNRIADWTVEVLAVLLKEIQVRRKASNIKSDPRSKISMLETPMGCINLGPGDIDGSKKTVIDEVEEIILLPEFNKFAAKKEQQMDPTEISLNPEVFGELRDYVRTIASLYNDNAFHNFAHANHVTMSVVKLLSRIVAPDIEDQSNKTLHDHTYGITSDPLTRFAVVFSALIHDVDHTGVSNMQLVKEDAAVAKLYNNKSVAEQNSVDLAWDLLMEPQYENLRRQIYKTEAEFKRFRQLVVNSVMATDILDKDLKKLRNDRWDAAFSLSEEEEKSSRLAVNRKATIVIEHLIQASDVAHTMQHWHIYRKWNERFFREMYKAYTDGRMDKDPSENWYKGEIGFFDYYIIPLAKKLKDCGVFGVSSDEYLSYAQQNRKEWEERGEEVVAEMLASVKRKSVADKVMAIQEQMVDKEGHRVIAEMSKTMKETAARQLSQKDLLRQQPPAQQQQPQAETLPEESAPRRKASHVTIAPRRKVSHVTVAPGGGVLGGDDRMGNDDKVHDFPLEITTVQGSNSFGGYDDDDDDDDDGDIMIPLK